MANLDFIKRNLQQSNTEVKADKPKAEFWINIGYAVTVQTSEGTEKRFVTLPFGLPLDTMADVQTASSSEFFSALQGAKNDLKSQMLSACSKLRPGEEMTIIRDTTNGLEVRIRRVNDAAPTISTEQNPFIKKLVL